MKLFPNLVKGITDSLRNIFEKKYHADKVIEYLFNDNPKWGSRDRAFVAESVFDITRQWRRLWAISQKEISFDEATLMELFGIYWILKDNDLPEWTEFSKLNVGKIMRAKRAGADGYLMKPFNRELLFNAIKSVTPAQQTIAA